MLSEQVRILNFDGSLIKQNKLLEQFYPLIIDLQEIGPLARLWLNKKIETRIKNALNPELKDSITFLGSGDYHHISSILIEQFQEPLSVIIFDNHPDWDILSPKTGCGSWVSRILQKPEVKKVILLGAASDDLSNPNILSANLSSLKLNRLELYPYAHHPTKVFFKKIAPNLSTNLKQGIFYQRIFWQELKGKNLAEFTFELISRLVTKQVYISIDKDCLQSQYALTNWQAGLLSLDDLLLMLRIIKENADIVGLDIAGDYSKINIQGKIKSICSYLDHPLGYSAKDKSESMINSVNELSNIKILELFMV